MHTSLSNRRFSLKLVDSMFCARYPQFDNWVSTSFRWLTPSEVNKYQDEVKRPSKVLITTAVAMAAVVASLTPSMTTSHLDQDNLTDTSPTSNDFPDGPADNVPDGATPDVGGDIAWLNINELNDKDADSLQKCINTCVERWKAAGPEVLFAILVEVSFM
ncbi:hypothetical protein B0H14DRAFT_2651832 [Mycena olivaceomarginata]|nr:hypothetical protein B0H14DRAFT_2651832 [Mycena olivaceomarginata]